MNTSSGNLTYNLPYWQAVTVPLLLTHALLILLPSIFLNSTILLVLIYRKEHHKPLSLGIGAINAMALSNSLIIGPLAYVLIPRILQYCDCTLRTAFAFSSAFFNFLVQPLFVCGLAIFQLVIVRNGQNALKFKLVSIYLAVSLIGCVSFLTVLLLTLDSPLRNCYEFCTNTLSPSNFANIANPFLAIFFVWIPSSVVIGICYVWIFVLYQSRSLRTDTNLTCKMLSLPALMPFTLFILNAPVAFFAIIISYVGQFQLPAYITILTINATTLSLDVSGLAYPLLLLFLNHYVRKDWKAMLVLLGGTAFNWLKFLPCKCCPCKKHTQIAPAPETTHAQETVQETDL